MGRHRPRLACPEKCELQSPSKCRSNSVIVRRPFRNLPDYRSNCKDRCRHTQLCRKDYLVCRIRPPRKKDQHHPCHLQTNTTRFPALVPSRSRNLEPAPPRTETCSSYLPPSARSMPSGWRSRLSLALSENLF